VLKEEHSRFLLAKGVIRFYKKPYSLSVHIIVEIESDQYIAKRAFFHFN